jgi:AraC-like DNA-binding protein
MTEDGYKEAGVRAAEFETFWGLFRELGGDQAAILRELEPPVPSFRDGETIIPFRLTNRLFELVAKHLSCADFGMRLGSMPQSLQMFGPLHVAMQNAFTLRQAFQFYTAFLNGYCSSLSGLLLPTADKDSVTIAFDLQPQESEPNVQGAENFLAMVAGLLSSISHGRASPSEIWFRHKQVAPEASYRRYFQAPVRFEQPFNALVLPRSEFERNRPEGNRQLFDLATYFLHHEYKPVVSTFAAQVRKVILQQLALGESSPIVVAAQLGTSARSLQRRLSLEGTTFEAVKDDLRRELAIRKLSMPGPFGDIVESLGYSEASVLTRSCYRWFGDSPRGVRARLKSGAEIRAG